MAKQLFYYKEDIDRLLKTAMYLSISLAFAIACLGLGIGLYLFY